MAEEKDKKSITKSLFDDLKDMEKIMAESTRNSFKNIIKEEFGKVFKEALDSEDDEKEVDKKDDAGENLDAAATSEIESGEGDEKEEKPKTDETEPTDLEKLMKQSDGGEEKKETETSIEDKGLESGEEEKHEDSIIDLTGKDYDDVINVFKKMNDDDQVTIDGSEVSIKDPDSGNEYIVKGVGEDNKEHGEETVEEAVEGMGSDVSSYESTMPAEGTDVNAAGTNPMETEKMNPIADGTEKPVDESAMNTVQNLHRQTNNPEHKPIDLGEAIAKSKEYESKYNALREEYKKLETAAIQLSEQFHKVISEQALYNYKLSAVTYLMTENATNKEEKLKIVSELDKAASKEEVDQLKESLSKELNDKVIVSEGKNVKTESSKDIFISENMKKFIERQNQLNNYHYKKH